MSKKQISFFFTHDDLITLAREITEVRPVDFVHGGLFSEPRLEVLTDVNDLNAFETYLVVDRGIRVNLRAVPQRTGGQMYAMDQVSNPHTIVLQVGGKLADQQLIAGQIGTVGNSKQSDELYAMFARAIRKRYEKIKSFYVGSEAAAMLDSGARLSATPKSPQAYDLVR
jgi:hypothetical protein